MIRVRAGVCFFAFALAACASAPLTLVALPPAPASGQHDTGSGASVLLREVVVPGYLDGFPVVLGRDGSALVVSRDTEWAERPSAGVGRVLRDALSQRLEPSRVLIEGDGRVPDADLSVEFLALDPQPAGLHLDARWYFSCVTGRGSRAGRSELQVPLPKATAPAVAAATSEAIARFADVLVQAIPTECRRFADDLAGGRR